MFWWLERFHMTPDQVAALPIKYRHRLPLVAEVVDEIKAEKQKAAEKGR